jgi:hypothetical protein
LRRRLTGHSGKFDYEIGWWWSDADGLALDLREEPQALAFAGSLLAQAENRAALRALFSAEGGGARRLDEDELRRLLVAALRSGRLRVTRLPMMGLAAADQAEAEETAGQPDTGPESEPKTWIAIKLLGEDDKPIPGARYWIKLPDTSVREGSLDAEGYAYFGDLDPGQCEIRWPDLDDGAVKDASAEMVAPAARPGASSKPWSASAPTAQGAGTPPTPVKTWIQLQLVGEDGAPIPGEAYAIRLPGGQVREGVLDARGTAYFDDLDPGQCEISWPNLDKEAVAGGSP